MRRCCTSHYVRFALTPYSIPPLFEYHGPGTNHTGYLPDLIDTLALDLGFDYEIKTADVRQGSAPEHWRSPAPPAHRHHLDLCLCTSPVRGPSSLRQLESHHRTDS